MRSEEIPTAWRFVGVLSDFVVEQDIAVSEMINVRLATRGESDILRDLIADGTWDDRDLGWLHQELDVPMLVLDMQGDDIGELKRSAKESFDDALLALRLLAPGEVRLTVFAFFPMDEDPLYWGDLETVDRPAWSRNYMTGLHRQTAIASTYLKVHMTTPPESIQRAIDYFGRSYSDEEPVSRIWNVWAGMEAAYWNDSADIEFMRKCLICWRAAKVTGIPERSLSDSYGHLRSKTSHGQSSAQTIDDESVEFVKDALRQSISLALNEPPRFESIRKDYPPNSRCRRRRS